MSQKLNEKLLPNYVLITWSKKNSLNHFFLPKYFWEIMYWRMQHLVLKLFYKHTLNYYCYYYYSQAQRDAIGQTFVCWDVPILWWGYQQNFYDDKMSSYNLNYAFRHTLPLYIFHPSQKLMPQNARTMDHRKK